MRIVTMYNGVTRIKHIDTKYNTEGAIATEEIGAERNDKIVVAELATVMVILYMLL